MGLSLGLEMGLGRIHHHRTIEISLFEVVYGFNPLTLFDLIPLPTLFDFVHKERVSESNFMKDLHEKVKTQIHQQTKRYTKYKNKWKREFIFSKGDLV